MPIGTNAARRRPTAEYGQRNHCQDEADPRDVAKALHENPTDKGNRARTTSQDFPCGVYPPNQGIPNFFRRFQATEDVDWRSHPRF